MFNATVCHAGIDVFSREPGVKVNATVCHAAIDVLAENLV